jgi:CheY-like chemotaxis protein
MTPIAPILVVDDDDDCRALSRARLEKEGFDVVEARDGRDALDYLLSPNAIEPFCVLLDIEMPRMNGPELIRVLRSYLRLAQIPVIVLSAHAESALFDPSEPAHRFPKGADFREILGAMETYAPTHRRRRSPGASGVIERLNPAELEADERDSNEPPPAKVG